MIKRFWTGLSKNRRLGLVTLMLFAVLFCTAQTISEQLYVVFEDGGTTNRPDVITLEHETTSTPTTGFGATLKYQLEDLDAGAIEYSYNYYPDKTTQVKFWAYTDYRGNGNYPALVGVLVAPDNSDATTAGNVRGFGAVDFCTNRSADTQVASGDYATVSGGKRNTASGESAVVGGGYGNVASNTQATVGGGGVNSATHVRSTVAGGYANNATNHYATVGGGYNNDATNQYATVVGGEDNVASGMYAFVGGGSTNTASGDQSLVVGGGGPLTCPPYNDQPNHATADIAVVVGGQDNYASGLGAFVGGGRTNRAGSAVANFCTIVGGTGNDAQSGHFSLIGSGWNNETLYRDYSTILNGRDNLTFGHYSTILNGQDNRTSGSYSTVINGQDSKAGGDYSTAIGNRAHANNYGEFAVASASTSITSTGNAQFSLATFARINEGITSGWKEVFLDTGESERFNLSDYGELLTFRIQVSIMTSDAGKIGSYEIIGSAFLESMLKAVVVNYTVNTIYETDASWDVRVHHGSVGDNYMSVEFADSENSGDTVNVAATMYATKVRF